MQEGILNDDRCTFYRCIGEELLGDSLDSLGVAAGIGLLEQINDGLVHRFHLYLYFP